MDLDVHLYRAGAVKFDVGAEFALYREIGTGDLEPHVQMSWTHETRFLGKTVSANLTGQNCTFSVEGMSPDRSYFSLIVGTRAVFLAESLFLSLDYEGAYGHGYRSNQGSFQVQMNW